MPTCCCPQHRRPQVRLQQPTAYAFTRIQSTECARLGPQQLTASHSMAPPERPLCRCSRSPQWHRLPSAGGALTLSLSPEKKCFSPQHPNRLHRPALLPPCTAMAPNAGQRAGQGTGLSILGAMVDADHECGSWTQSEVEMLPINFLLFVFETGTPMSIVV